MKKIDYLKLADKLREIIQKFENLKSNPYADGRTHEDYIRIESDAMQARSLARYFAEHLSVNKAEFLNACGLKSTS